MNYFAFSIEIVYHRSSSDQLTGSNFVVPFTPGQTLPNKISPSLVLMKISSTTPWS